MIASTEATIIAAGPMCETISTMSKDSFLSAGCPAGWAAASAEMRWYMSCSVSSRGGKGP